MRHVRERAPADEVNVVALERNSTKEGALRLAATLTAYWRAKGYGNFSASVQEVKIGSRFHTKASFEHWGVRSNLKANGLPSMRFIPPAASDIICFPRRCGSTEFVRELERRAYET